MVENERSPLFMGSPVDNFEDEQQSYKQIDDIKQQLNNEIAQTEQLTSAISTEKEKLLSELDNIIKKEKLKGRIDTLIDNTEKQFQLITECALEFSSYLNLQDQFIKNEQQRAKEFERNVLQENVKEKDSLLKKTGIEFLKMKNSNTKILNNLSEELSEIKGSIEKFDEEFIEYNKNILFLQEKGDAQNKLLLDYSGSIHKKEEDVEKLNLEWQNKKLSFNQETQDLLNDLQIYENSTGEIDASKLQVDMENESLKLKIQQELDKKIELGNKLDSMLNERSKLRDLIDKDQLLIDDLRNEVSHLKEVHLRNIEEQNIKLEERKKNFDEKLIENENLLLVLENDKKTYSILELNLNEMKADLETKRQENYEIENSILNAEEEIVVINREIDELKVNGRDEFQKIKNNYITLLEGYDQTICNLQIAIEEQKKEHSELLHRSTPKKELEFKLNMEELHKEHDEMVKCFSEKYVELEKFNKSLETEISLQKGKDLINDDPVWMRKEIMYYDTEYTKLQSQYLDMKNKLRILELKRKQKRIAIANAEVEKFRSKLQKNQPKNWDWDESSPEEEVTTGNIHDVPTKEPPIKKTKI